MGSSNHGATAATRSSHRSGAEHPFDRHENDHAVRPTSQTGPLETPDTDAGLPRTRPPGRYRQVERWCLDSFSELTRLRAGLAPILRPDDGTGAGLAQTPEKVVLVASELATNALEHGRPPTVVTLLTDDASWLLDVADHDRGSVPVYAGERVPGAGGLGLHLARTLALDVGWYVTDTHKHIWVTFPVE
jgi:hypothetical protein